jgi:hypothetical protein
MNRNRILVLTVGLASLGWNLALAQELTPVVSKAVSRTVDVPGEFLPFEVVSLHAKMPGYAWPERTCLGTVSRISGALDSKTRAMPVELDVVNGGGLLALGMYPLSSRRSGDRVLHWSCPKRAWLPPLSEHSSSGI